MEKFIFIINYPRGGGKSLSSLKKIHGNKSFFVWPYEFFYFSLFNKASNNKKKEIGFKLNNFFYDEIKNKVNKFQDKVNLTNFKNYLQKENNTYFTNIEYLYYLINNLKKSYITKKKIANNEFFIINTTARGFDWSLNSKNFIFFSLIEIF